MQVLQRVAYVGVEFFTRVHETGAENYIVDFWGTCGKKRHHRSCTKESGRFLRQVNADILRCCSESHKQQAPRKRGLAPEFAAAAANSF
jgi:hypothetical protein